MRGAQERRESMRGRTQVQPQTLEAPGYVLVFTTLAPSVQAAQVMTLYRLRWQIELEVKRLKLLIQLEHLKKHDARAARSWLQGKLLVALLIARLIAHAERVSPWGYEIGLLAAPPPESAVRGVRPLSCSGCRGAASRPICSLPTRLASGRLCAIGWPNLLAGGCCSGKKGRELLS